MGGVTFGHKRSRPSVEARPSGSALAGRAPPAMGEARQYGARAVERRERVLNKASRASRYSFGHCARFNGSRDEMERIALAHNPSRPSVEARQYGARAVERRERVLNKASRASRYSFGHCARFNGRRDEMERIALAHQSSQPSVEARPSGSALVPAKPIYESPLAMTRTNRTSSDRRPLNRDSYGAASQIRLDRN